MSRPLRVLIVEDSQDDAELLLRELRRGGFDPDFERVETVEGMRAALQGREWDLVVSDYRMPQFSAQAALEVLKADGPDIPFIIVSGTIGEETAVGALKAGAHDFLIKSNLARLLPAIEREVREAGMRREHRKLEEQFLQAQKMEAIGRLAGGVAHDFNNLLTIITGYGELLLQRLEPASPLRAYAQEIKLAGDRATALTRQLLAFSRQQVVAPQVLDLNQVLSNMEKMLRRLIGEDIELVTIPAAGLGRVKADSGQFDQVIMNLAVNARDAMPKGGKLTIEAANADLDEAYAQSHYTVKPGPHVMLAVSDTGIGMDKETQSHIFEPFFTTKEQGKGTGLGLATVYGIVKRSDGYIWVYSEPGKGTTFRIYLPRVDEPAPADPAPEVGSETHAATETLLLVEDEASVRSLVRVALEARGYSVLEAQDGVEALKLCQEHQGPIHLLLTDTVMPRMNGPELAVRLKSLRPQTRVLYMSGYTDVKLGGMDEGSFAFIQKPFTGELLARKVREVLESPQL